MYIKLSRALRSFRFLDLIHSKKIGYSLHSQIEGFNIKIREGFLVAMVPYVMKWCFNLDKFSSLFPKFKTIKLLVQMQWHWTQPYPIQHLPMLKVCMKGSLSMWVSISWLKVAQQKSIGELQSCVSFKRAGKWTPYFECKRNLLPGDCSFLFKGLRSAYFWEFCSKSWKASAWLGGTIGCRKTGVITLSLAPPDLFSPPFCMLLCQWGV